MTDLEDRVRRALDAQHAPESLRRRTLAAIEEARARQGAAGADEDAPSVARADSPSVANAPADACAPHPDPAPAADAPAPSAAVRAAARRHRSPWRIAVAAAACLVLLAGSLGLWHAYREPVAFIGIDVNPSIELGVNCFDIVVEARPLNDDGRVLLDQVSLTGRPYRQAIDELAASAAFAPYADAGSLVEVSVASADAALADRLSAQTDAALAPLPCDHACATVDAEVRAQADAAGMGMARYQAAQELIALDPTATLDECAALTMRELRDRIDACAGHGSESSDDSPSGEGAGHGHHATAGEGNAAEGAGSSRGRGPGADSAGKGARGHGRHDA